MDQQQQLMLRLLPLGFSPTTTGGSNQAMSRVYPPVTAHGDWYTVQACISSEDDEVLVTLFGEGGELAQRTFPTVLDARDFIANLRGDILQNNSWRP